MGFCSLLPPRDGGDYALQELDDDTDSNIPCLYPPTSFLKPFGAAAERETLTHLRDTNAGVVRSRVRW